ncbi:Golgin candidate 5, partial [Haematococcus lacustris]
MSIQELEHKLAALSAVNRALKLENEQLRRKLEDSETGKMSGMWYLPEPFCQASSPASWMLLSEDEVEDLKEEFQARLGAADRTIASLQDDKSKLQASLAAALAGGSHQGAQLQALQATVDSLAREGEGLSRK